MSEHAYQRVLVDGAWDLDVGLLALAIGGSPLPAATGVSVRAGGADLLVVFGSDLDAAQIQSLDQIVDDVRAQAVGAQLDALKAAKRSAIEARTVELLAQGFEHVGKRFSLSKENQIYFTNLYFGRAELGLLGAFPLPLETLDGAEQYVLVDATEMEQMYTAIAQTVLGIELGEGQLKEAIRNAQSKAELDQIVDPR